MSQAKEQISLTNGYTSALHTDWGECKDFVLGHDNNQDSCHWHQRSGMAVICLIKDKHDKDLQHVELYCEVRIL